MAIYKYMSAEIGLKYLRTWHLKYTPPRDFNDPFDVLPSIPTEYDLPFGDVRIPDNALAMLSESMAKARSTDPVKVATATSGLKFQGFNGEAEMRKTDHQMQQALYITAWTKADAKNPYSVENTGFNFQEVRIIPAHVASTPTSCQMKRP